MAWLVAATLPADPLRGVGGLIPEGLSADRSAMPRLLALLLIAAVAGCSPAASQAQSAPTTSSASCGGTTNEAPTGSAVQHLKADLDGDGRLDSLMAWDRVGVPVVQAQLATGQSTAPEHLFAGDLLSSADVDGDGRAEVFAGVSADRAIALQLVDCKLRAVEWAVAPRVGEFAVGPGAALVCFAGARVEEVVTEGPETVRRAWTLKDGVVTGVRPNGSGPAGDNAGKIVCGK
jgi:hypothetical protein